MILGIHFDGIGKINIRKKELSEIIQIICKNEGFIAKQIDIIFTTDKGLLDINRRYLNRTDYTDIITFGSNRKKSISGELYVSLERVQSNSRKFSKEIFENELYRVIIHGVLHLVGYKEANDSKGRLLLK